MAISKEVNSYIKHFCVMHKLPCEFYRAAKKIAEEKDSISISELKILEKGFISGRHFQHKKTKERFVLWANKTFEDDTNDMSFL